MAGFSGDCQRGPVVLDPDPCQDAPTRQSPEQFFDFDQWQVRDEGWVETQSGASSWAILSGGDPEASEDHPGVVVGTLGDDAGATLGYRRDNDSWALGSAAGFIELSIHLDTVPTGVDDYTVELGVGDTGSAVPSDGFWFSGSTAGGGNWECRSAAAAVRTTAATTKPVQAGWARLRIEWNRDATELRFFIDGEHVATITTNIPSGVGQMVGPRLAARANPAGPGVPLARIGMDYWHNGWNGLDR